MYSNSLIRPIHRFFLSLLQDTEFPGVIARPIGSFLSQSEFGYQMIRCNADLLNVIQIGITLADQDGNTPVNCPTWQFNFRYNLAENPYSEESITLLRKSGIDFDSHAIRGIEPAKFGEFMISSGLILNEKVTWLTFHSGYDFAYYLKLVTDLPLPATEVEFLEMLRIYFPRIFDVKYIVNRVCGAKGGLNQLGKTLNVNRTGPLHQAGSDSLFTADVFFEARKQYFPLGLEESVYLNSIFGLGTY